MNKNEILEELDQMQQEAEKLLTLVSKYRKEIKETYKEVTYGQIATETFDTLCQDLRMLRRRVQRFVD